MALSLRAAAATIALLLAVTSVASGLKIGYPNGGIFFLGETIPIVFDFDSEGPQSSLTLYLRKNVAWGSDPYLQTIFSTTTLGSVRTANWTIPLDMQQDVGYYIYGVAGSFLSTYSAQSENFQIQYGGFRVLSPSAGSIWVRPASHLLCLSHVRF